MFSKLLRAEELGIRLEIVGGLPIWEPHPVWKHQKAVDRIRATIKPLQPVGQEPCLCVHAADVYVKFPDGSLKRPDISIFCREPNEEEEAITLVPEAVIEVVSKGYEAKDLEIAPRFYRSQGVKDIVIFDPYTLEILYFTQDSEQQLHSPARLNLVCGCECTI